MDRGLVLVDVEPALGGRDDVVDLVGAGLAANVAAVSVALEDPPRVALLLPAALAYPLPAAAAFPRFALVLGARLKVRAAGLGAYLRCSCQ